MTTSEQNTNQELPPIIPSWVLLAVVGLGILLGIVVALLQGEFGIVAGASFLVSFIALLAWALMFPEQLLDIVKGRSFAFGGMAVLVTVILIVAAGFVYIVIKQQAWRTDISERDLYSLDEEVHDVLEAMGQDPRIPAVTFIGLYGPANADDRDRFEVLFNDMANVANGKISYQFVDPNREVRFVEQYAEDDTVLRAGQVIVAATDPETGVASTENFEIIFARDTAQFELINAMLTLSAVGDFRAYFLSLEGGLDMTRTTSSGGNQFIDELEGDNWTVEQISPLQIIGDNPQVALNDVAANAEVLVMAGGSEPLDEAAMTTVQNYAVNGGDLVIFGDINTTGGISTAQAENMSTFLWENYGVRLNDDLVLDPDNTVGNPETIIIKNYDTHPIVQGLTDSDFLVMEFSHSIEIAETLPAGVTVTILASTADTGYTKTGLDFSQDFTDEQLASVEGDISGEIVVAVAVENTNTGSRLVLVGSDALLKNDYRQYRDIVSPEVVMSAIVWSSDAQDFANDINRLIPDTPAADAPIFITDASLQWMGATALVFLPFGTLALGLLVWWLQRKSRLAN